MKSIEKILVAIDFSDNSDYAFDYALFLAQQFEAHLTIVHVINEPVDLSGFYVPHISFEQFENEIRESSVKMMDQFCSARLAGFSNYTTAVESGLPCEEILQKAADIDASLIVVGTHGRTGLDHLIFGSTAERVVRNATCPVLSIRLPEA